MDVFVVSYGDSYDRSVVGVALSLDDARALARSYQESERRVADGYRLVVSDAEWFRVARYTSGVVNDCLEDELYLD
jgi:hypothetical protein